MRTTLKDETGHRYGRLTVLRRYGVKKPSGNGAYWLCKCDCGNEYVAHGIKLRNGNTRSCGCLVEMGPAERKRLGFRPYMQILKEKKEAAGNA